MSASLTCLKNSSVLLRATKSTFFQRKWSNWIGLIMCVACWCLSRKMLHLFGIQASSSMLISMAIKKSRMSMPVKAALTSSSPSLSRILMSTAATIPGKNIWRHTNKTSTTRNRSLPLCLLFLPFGQSPCSWPIPSVKSPYKKTTMSTFLPESTKYSWIGLRREATSFYRHICAVPSLR